MLSGMLASRFLAVRRPKQKKFIVSNWIRYGKERIGKLDDNIKINYETIKNVKNMHCIHIFYTSIEFCKHGP